MGKLQNGRVVNVSSMAHQFCAPELVDYSFSKLKEKYSLMGAYGFSKLAQIYHASELARRYNIKAYSLHPGSIGNTNLGRQGPQFLKYLLSVFLIMCKNVEQGAMTTLYCALSDDAKSGCYHSDCQVREPSDLALDSQRAAECWDQSERLICQAKEKWERTELSASDIELE